ncbi:MAG: Uma2 family endonuclease [Gemmataceae bacterium]|nr:Uma2 family endonuclease [Gemmataceae bacterium]
MPRTATRPPGNFAQVLHRLGDIPLERIRSRPAPGTAKESHLLAALKRDGVPCELVDGVLVEKAVGFTESGIASILIGYFRIYLMANRLGVVLAPDGLMRLAPGLVRMPDVSFVRWSKLPGRVWPRDAIPDVCPCLAVEVVSSSNTGPEILRKAREYFGAGTEIVWLVDPARREVRVHASPTEFRTFRAGDLLDGGTVLPGLSIPVAALFEDLPPDEE